MTFGFRAPSTVFVNSISVIWYSDNERLCPAKHASSEPGPLAQQASKNPLGSGAHNLSRIKHFGKLP